MSAAGGAPRVRRMAERRLELWRMLGQHDRWSWLAKTYRGEQMTSRDLLRYKIDPSFTAIMRRNRGLISEVLKFAPLPELRALTEND